MTTRRRTSTTRTPTRPTQGKTKSPFDITGSTHLDEYLLPFALFCVVIPLLGVGAYFWCQRSGQARLLVPAALMLIGGMAFFALWHEAKARTVHNRARAAAAAAWLFLQPAVTIVVGPANYTWTTVWFLVGFAFGVWFIFRKQEVVRGDGADEHSPAEDPLAVKIGLHETTRAKILEDSDTRMRLRVTHRWDPQANVLKGFETITRLKGLPATGMRIVPTDDSGVSEVELMKVDMLKHSQPWPGVTCPGTSVMQPVAIGTMQDGTPMEIVRPGDHEAGRSAIHTITMGMSGAGKTKFMMNEVGGYVQKYDIVIWLSDTSKAAQTVGYFRPAVDWLATSLPQTKLMVQAIDRIITKRAGLLGEHDMEQWTPEAWEILGMPYLYVGFQEAARVLTDDMGQEAVVRIGEAARSVGISLDFSLQRASHSNMPTDLRSVVGSGVCFGVKEDVDATMCLSPDTIDAGARPEAWRTTKPGACYLEASHVDPTHWSMPGRTFDISGQALRDVVAEYAPKMARLDKATTEAAGDAYAQRQIVTVDEWLKTVRGPRRVIAVPSRTTVPNAAAASPNGAGPNTPNSTTVAVLDPEDDPNDDTDEPTVEEVQQMAADDAEGMKELLEQMDDPQDFGPDDLAAFMTVDPREEIDPNAGPDVEFGETWAPGAPLTYEQRCAAFRDIVNLFFRAHGDQGHVDTTTEALFDEWRQVPGNAAGGDPRPSLSRLLRKAEAAGRVEDRGRGKWRLLPEVTTWDPTERVSGDVDDDVA